MTAPPVSDAESDQEELERAAALLEDRAGAYLYAAWSAYQRAGNAEKAAAMTTALEAVGRAPAMLAGDGSRIA